MTTFLGAWSEAAVPILEKALETKTLLAPAPDGSGSGPYVVFGATVEGPVSGQFLVKAAKASIESLPKLGADAVLTLWPELFERIAGAASDRLSGQLGATVTSSATEEPDTNSEDGVPFLLTVGGISIPVLFVDSTRSASQAPDNTQSKRETVKGKEVHSEIRTPSQFEGANGSRGMDLLLDVELEASLRFGSREMPLSEVMELGPGDVVQLDRHIADPVDLIVGDKIVARGEVVLISGAFGLRITEVATPQRRLETIRCLF